MLNFETKIFNKQTIGMGGTEEQIVKGGRDLFPLLPKAFDGIKTIGVIGWGSQGPAQAQNLRDSLEGTDITVKIGLREGSGSIKNAEEAGFTKANGTLGEMMQIVAESDLVILLISDCGQTETYKEIFKTIKPGATLGLSHGFLVGYLKNIGESFPSNINIIAVCPKGMGPSVRRLYEQGKEVNGAGINCSFAVQQDVNGKATDYALGWAVAVGAPYIFMTTMENEYKSDIFGERGVLLGGAYGMSESLYRWFSSKGMESEQAFIEAVESLTGSISKIISHKGILGLAETFTGEDKKSFEKAYAAAYPRCKRLLLEIYEETACGIELESVVLSTKRSRTEGLETVENSPMWQIGKKVRGKRGSFDIPTNPVTAGLYAAMMMAQGDLLKEKGHPLSEIVNESVIEAVDSLYPYLHARGIAYMIDNCSMTAKIGARRWGPRFDYIFTQQVFPDMDSVETSKLIEAFKTNPLHDALKEAGKLRPPVDIFVEA